MSARSVLIVEPNPGILIVGRNVLARAGFTVIAVASVEEGLAHARRRSLDAILLDGRHSELEVLLALSRSRPHGVPIVLTVQKGRDVLTLETLEAAGFQGAVDIADIIEKPFAPERLLQAVERAVERAGQRPPLASTGELSAPSRAYSSGEATREDLIARPVFARATSAEDLDLLERTDPALRVDPLLRALERSDEDIERTDRIQPFESLLDSVSPEREPSKSWTGRAQPVLDSGVDVRRQRLTRRIRAALEGAQHTLDVGAMERLVLACESAIAEESARDGAAQGTRALAGYIEHIPIDQVLQLAAGVAPPVRCRLEYGDGAIEVFFEGGQVVFARQERMPEGFTLGRLLSALGVVNQRDVDRAVNARGKGLLGRRLVSQGLIQERDLSEALRRQTEELVYEAVRWGAGRFAIFARESLPTEAAEAGLHLPMHHLLLEGMRRLDEWRRMAGEVGGLGSVLDRRQGGDERQLIESLRPEERMLLEQVDGRKTVEELVQHVPRPTFDVVRAIHQLSSKRLVTIVAPAVHA